MDDNNNEINDEEKKEEKEDYLNLKNVFDFEIYDVIDQIKEESNLSKEYISKSSEEILKLNESFKEDIVSYIKDKTSLYEDLFNLNKDESQNSTIDLKIFTKKTIKSLKKILKLHSQIIDTIKQHFEIYKNFLNISKYLNSQNPSEEFIFNKFEDIINSWLYLKIDFEKFNFNDALKNCRLEENFKKLILDMSKSRKLYLKFEFPTIIPDDNNDYDKKIFKKNIETIVDNQPNLIGMEIENLEDFDLVSSKTYKFSKLKKFYIKNVGNKQSFKFEKAPKLEKFRMKCCYKLNVSLLDKFPEKLKKLYLEKNNFHDKEFYYIMDNLILKNKSIMNNLEILSFEKNNLSKIDLLYINSKCVFNSLTELNFKKNKICVFNLNKNNFRKLQYINCCYNYLNKSYLGEMQSIIGLESANLFLLNNELFDKYYKQIKEKLTLKSEKMNYYKISYINISYIPKSKNAEYFNNFAFHESIILSLKKLDLSYCGLKNDIFFQFMKNNKGFLNLRSLNLTGNNFDDTFFEEYLELDILNKLEHLNLSSNNIGDEKIKINYKDEIPINENILKSKKIIYKLRLIYKFIEKNKCITKLTLSENPISKMYLINDEYMYKSNQNNTTIEEYIKTDENKNIIINCFISFFYKVQGELIKSSDSQKVNRNHVDVIFSKKYKDLFQ